MPENLQELIKENEQLRALCLELEEALRQSSANKGGGMGSEAEILLEEKTEIIRGLHAQNQGLKKQLQKYEGGSSESGETNPEVGQQASAQDDFMQAITELENKKKELELSVASLEKTLQEEEVRMSKERAEVARQRYEVEKTRKELEIELSRNSQEGSLKDKIQNLKSKLMGK